MTADEKHISKLAGDMKYDKKHHGSPAKSSGNRNDHDMSESYWKAHKNTEHGRRAHGDMSVNEKQVAAEKNRKFPKKDTEKTYSQKKVTESIKNRKNKKIKKKKNMHKEKTKHKKGNKNEATERERKETGTTR